MIFSVVIPTYNHAHSIGQTIDSAIHQSFDKDYEILVVDNASTDHTQHELERFRNRIRVIKNPETVSLIENHNVCLKHASGDYIIFCHSDDRLLPDALENYYQKVSERNFPSRYVLWGKSEFRDFQANWEKPGLKLEQVATGEKVFQAFMIGGLTPSGTCFSRKSFWEAGGYIPTDTVIAPSDMVSMWRLILNGFEFEMSEKKFFIREFASTATERSQKKWREAKSTAVRNFLQVANPGEMALLKKYIAGARNPDINTLLALRNNNLVSDLDIFRHLSLNLSGKLTSRFPFRSFKYNR